MFESKKHIAGTEGTCRYALDRDGDGILAFAE